ncbi:MAG: hypothetical protein LBB53_01810, partial [Prevotellaceae bacterium]|nr:hypothetical protein [Prevotellaceae bacterium]
MPNFDIQKKTAEISDLAKIIERQKIETKSKSVNLNAHLFVMRINQRYGNKPETVDLKDKSEPAPVSAQNAGTKRTSPKSKKEKPSKPAKAKPADTAVRVEKILPEVNFIRRFAHLNGKMIKTQQETALRLLNSLQKAIVERVIRKTSPYAAEIMAIQENLI